MQTDGAEWTHMLPPVMPAILAGRTGRGQQQLPAHGMLLLAVVPLPEGSVTAWHCQLILMPVVLARDGYHVISINGTK